MQPTQNEPRNNLDDDGQFIDATCKTVDSPSSNRLPCIFPFVYKSVLYTHCTTVDYNQPWCATATNTFGGFINEKWGICNLTTCTIKPESCQLQSLNTPWSGYVIYLKYQFKKNTKTYNTPRTSISSLHSTASL